jgi:hypothetical protein
MSGHANNKQSNAETHRSKPSTRLRIQDLDPLYVVVSRSATATTIVTNANRAEFPSNRRFHLAKSPDGVQ